MSAVRAVLSRADGCRDRPPRRARASQLSAWCMPGGPRQARWRPRGSCSRDAPGRRSESRPPPTPAGGRDGRARAAARRRAPRAGAGASRQRVRHRDHGRAGVRVDRPSVRRPGHSRDRRSHRRHRRRHRGHPRPAAGCRLRRRPTTATSAAWCSRSSGESGRPRSRHPLPTRWASWPPLHARECLQERDGGCRDPGVHGLRAVAARASPPRSS